eukprot:9495047-Pyramimonas_sp.AAC.1
MHVLSPLPSSPRPLALFLPSRHPPRRTSPRASNRSQVAKLSLPPLAGARSPPGLLEDSAARQEDEGDQGGGRGR